MKFMKKSILIRSIAVCAAFVLAFSAVSAAPGILFTRDLSVGATGPDVVALQNWLLANGYDIPAIRTGAAAKGFFGTQTRAAVAAYQRAVGLPDFGYFGPLTRGRINSDAIDFRGQSLRITSPNGGETWHRDSIQTITWSGTPGLLSQEGSLWLEYNTPPCADPNQPVRCMIAVHEPVLLNEHVKLSAQSYSWRVGTVGISLPTVPPVQNFVPVGQYRIRICQAMSTACDSSDGAFNIAPQIVSVCPTEKIVNRMPSIGTSTQPSSYYIVNGERHELSEFDSAWIAANCSVREQTVY